MNDLNPFSLGACLILAFMIVATMICLPYFIPNLFMRRRERARLFLDVLEIGLENGSRPETTIGQFAETDERSLGRKFPTLAAYLRGGMPLIAALKAIPKFIPPRVVAILEAGVSAGDIRKALPVARKTLDDGNSLFRSTTNYWFYYIEAIVFLPALFFLAFKFFPKLQWLFADFQEWNPPISPVSTLIDVFVHHYRLAFLLIIGLFLLPVILYLHSFQTRPYFVPEFWKPVYDRLLLTLPWRRKRLYRDFSMMLSWLLDAGIFEEQAILLAAMSTDNPLFLRRSQAAVDRLRAGDPLATALKAIDRSGEFAWRLANAIRAGHGFERALAGWHESLDARAFQQEQALSQVTSTALIVFNGIIVGLLGFWFFESFSSLLVSLALW
jgi:type II secretory pathway component PulF